MKSYIFDCDSFVPNAGGGTFRKGRRRLAFACSCPSTNALIAELVERGLAFRADSLPGNVMGALDSAGVIRAQDEHDNLDRQDGRARVGPWARCEAAAGASLPSNAYLAYVYLQACGGAFRATLMRNSSIVILDRRIVAAIVRPWTWLANPAILAILALMELVWLSITSPSLYLMRPSAVFTMPGVDQVAIVILTVLFMLAHEFAHAATSRNRTGDCGPIRMGRMLCFLPYLFTTIPKIEQASTADRFLISASGIVIQLAISIILIATFPEIYSVRTAAALSIMMALFNLLPIRGFDGYWMVCDLLGRPLRLALRWGKSQAGDVCYTVVLAALLVAGFVVLKSLGVQR